MRRISLISLTLAALLLAHAPAVRAQQEPDLLKQRAVLELPGMSSVQVDTGIVFRTVAGRSLKFDLFHPSGASKAKKAPLVIFVNGIPGARACGERARSRGQRQQQAQGQQE